MANITQMAKTAGTLSGRAYYPASNRPSTDRSLQPQYVQAETVAYAQEVGQYATNVFAADCQGLNPNDFFEWRRVKLRSIRAAQAQTGSTMPGDWQRIYIIAPANYTYLPQGALIKYSDNTWIVFKDKNIAAVHGSAIVRRCNAVVNVLDWYGNIVHIPISYAKMETLGNAPHTTENTITSKNYIACICQLNEYTEAFDENTRILLGRTAYALRGLDDFTREFTDDPDSVHLLTFTIERVEVQPQDNVKLGVADYDGFSWEIAVNWLNSMMVGQTQTLTVESQRNNVAVVNTDEHPVSYYFESTDEDILTVDEYGTVTAVAEGNASIIVSLAQNPDITKTVEIEVPAAESAYVAFTTTIPDKLHEYDEITVTADYFEDGLPTGNALEFSFTGPKDGSFTVKHLLGNVYTVESYFASSTPLTITARYGEYAATATVYLVT